MEGSRVNIPRNPTIAPSTTHSSAPASDSKAPRQLSNYLGRLKKSTRSLLSHGLKSKNAKEDVKQKPATSTRRSGQAAARGDDFAFPPTQAGEPIYYEPVNVFAPRPGIRQTQPALNPARSPAAPSPNLQFGPAGGDSFWQSWLPPTRSMPITSALTPQIDVANMVDAGANAASSSGTQREHAPPLTLNPPDGSPRPSPVMTAAGLVSEESLPGLTTTVTPTRPTMVDASAQTWAGHLLSPAESVKLAKLGVSIRRDDYLQDIQSAIRASAASQLAAPTATASSATQFPAPSRPAPPIPLASFAPENMSAKKAGKQVDRSDGRDAKIDEQYHLIGDRLLAMGYTPSVSDVSKLAAHAVDVDEMDGQTGSGLESALDEYVAYQIKMATPSSPDAPQNIANSPPNRPAPPIPTAIMKKVRFADELVTNPVSRRDASQPLVSAMPKPATAQIAPESAPDFARFGPQTTTTDDFGKPLPDSPTLGWNPLVDLLPVATQVPPIPPKSSERMARTLAANSTATETGDPLRDLPTSTPSNPSSGSSAPPASPTLSDSSTPSPDIRPQVPPRPARSPARPQPQPLATPSANEPVRPATPQRSERRGQPYPGSTAAQNLASALAASQDTVREQPGGSDGPIDPNVPPDRFASLASVGTTARDENVAGALRNTLESIPDPRQNRLQVRAAFDQANAILTAEGSLPGSSVYPHALVDLTRNIFANTQSLEVMQQVGGARQNRQVTPEQIIAAANTAKAELAAYSLSEYNIDYPKILSEHMQGIIDTPHTKLADDYVAAVLQGRSEGAENPEFLEGDSLFAWALATTQKTLSEQSSFDTEDFYRQTGINYAAGERSQPSTRADSPTSADDLDNIEDYYRNAPSAPDIGAEFANIEDYYRVAVDPRPAAQSADASPSNNNVAQAPQSPPAFENLSAKKAGKLPDRGEAQNAAYQETYNNLGRTLINEMGFDAHAELAELTQQAITEDTRNGTSGLGFQNAIDTYTTALDPSPTTSPRQSAREDLESVLARTVSSTSLELANGLQPTQPLNFSARNAGAPSTATNDTSTINDASFAAELLAIEQHLADMGRPASPEQMDSLARRASLVSQEGGDGFNTALNEFIEDPLKFGTPSPTTEQPDPFTQFDSAPHIPADAELFQMASPSATANAPASSRSNSFNSTNSAELRMTRPEIPRRNAPPNIGEVGGDRARAHAQSSNAIREFLLGMQYGASATDIAELGHEVDALNAQGKDGLKIVTNRILDSLDPAPEDTAPRDPNRPLSFSAPSATDTGPTPPPLPSRSESVIVAEMAAASAHAEMRDTLNLSLAEMGIKPSQEVVESMTNEALRLNRQGLDGVNIATSKLLDTLSAFTEEPLLDPRRPLSAEQIRLGEFTQPRPAPQPPVGVHRAADQPALAANHGNSRASANQVTEQQNAKLLGSKKARKLFNVLKSPVSPKKK